MLAQQVRFLPTAPLHRVAFVEPNGWSNHTDVIVIGGMGGAATANTLFDKGVQRVIAVLPEGCRCDVPAPAEVVYSAKALWQRLINFDPPPATVVVLTMPHGGLDEETWQAVRIGIKEKVFCRATIRHKGGTWVRHFLANMKHMSARPAVGLLRDAFVDKPCVVVSPGPSLAKNIQHLQTMRKRVLIIASNRAVAPLRAVGISPDFVVVSDPLDLTYQLDGNQLDGVGALLMDLTCNPKMFQLKARRNFVFTSVAEVHQSAFVPLDQEAMLASGGSVATVAFALGQHLGCNPIVMVGQDLALTGNRYYIDSAHDAGIRMNVSHGVGTLVGSSEQLKKAVTDLGEVKGDRSKVTQSCVKVRAWNGTDQVDTTAPFDMYRLWYEKVIPKASSRVRIVNATEGGAYIQGAEHLTLQTTLASLPATTIAIDSTLNQLVANHNDGKLKLLIRSHLATCQLAINTLMSELQLCQRLAKNYDPINSQVKLDRAEARLKKVLGQLPFMLALCNDGVEVANRKTANANSLDDVLGASRNLYASLFRASQLARPLLAEALKNMKPKKRPRK